jgi:Ca2+/H+ antiporter
VFVESVQQAAVAFGVTSAFVAVIVVALVGGAAEMVHLRTPSSALHLPALIWFILPS